jgi:hypothetical protein
LAISQASLSAWDRQTAEALFPEISGGAGVARPDGFITTGSVTVISLAQGLIWASLVIVPGASAAKRFSSRVSIRLIAAAAVVVLSSVAFCGFRTIHSSAPLAAFLMIGGFIGLAGIGVASLVLPPNKSFERTREG